MGNTIRIGYDGTKVTLSPTPQKFVVSKHGTSIQIIAQSTLPNNTVKFSLLLGAKYFANPPTGNVDLNYVAGDRAGSTLTLNLKQNKNKPKKRSGKGYLLKRPPSGDNSTPFPHLANFPPEDSSLFKKQYTGRIGLKFVTPTRPAANHTDMHMEC